MDHVLGKAPKDEGCLFEPPGKSRSSRNRLLLYRDLYTVVLLNRFPYANGHLLVAPVRHVSCITELAPEESGALMTMVQHATAIQKKVLCPDGINIGCNIGKVAGAGIADHLHLHLVPRWDGDHNFITVTADIRTIPEHIETTFDNLLPYFNAL